MSPVQEPFDWDDANITHLARHQTTPDEAEQVIRGTPLTIRTDMVANELRRRELGETRAGRLLIVISTARGYKIRVVTGWPADRTDRRYWEEQRRIDGT